MLKEKNASKKGKWNESSKILQSLRIKIVQVTFHHDLNWYAGAIRALKCEDLKGERQTNLSAQLDIKPSELNNFIQIIYH